MAGRLTMNAASTMTWTEVAGRLAAARTYWLSSTTTSGAPHAAPVWGVVTGETLYLYSERSTVKARNLAADPRVVVHLESGEDVLIIRGTAEDLGPPGRGARGGRGAGGEVHQPGGSAVPAGPRSRLQRRLGDQAAVGDGVAAGRLRRLAAPLAGLIVKGPPSYR